MINNALKAAKKTCAAAATGLPFMPYPMIAVMTAMMNQRRVMLLIV